MIDVMGCLLCPSSRVCTGAVHGSGVAARQGREAEAQGHGQVPPLPGTEQVHATELPQLPHHRTAGGETSQQVHSINRHGEMRGTGFPG